MSKLLCGIDNDLTAPMKTGNGSAMLVSGWCFHQEKQIKRIEISVEGRISPVLYYGKQRFDVIEHLTAKGEQISSSALTSGFSVVVPLPSVRINCKPEVYLLVYYTEGKDIIRLGDLDLRSGNLEKESPVPLPVFANDSKKVAICMATYNPKMNLFRQQIDSLISQSHKNWICIVHDDASNTRTFKEMYEYLSRDSRFILIRSEVNKGFYRNFEAALSYVPEDAEFVAFCDQDDYWNENKLERLTSEFKGGVSLVYSDMRLVDESGHVMSDTYWSTRKNNYRDLEFLLLANTITGAASMFRRSMMEMVLPFPQEIGAMYHDWWIALCAILSGEIKYIDEPLYDYCQHSGNVIGHSPGIAIESRIRSLVDTVRLRGKRDFIKYVLKHGEAVFDYDYARILLVTVLLIERFEGTKNKNYSVVKKFHKKMNWFGLSILFAKGKLLRRDTLGAELRLLLGVVSRSVLNRYYYKARQVIVQNANARLTTGVTIDSTVSAINIDSLEMKIAPLRIEADDDEPRRVNILIPTIDFKYFFGGYLGKFNLALKLARNGYQVRLVIVDYCEFNPELWRTEILKYPGLENFFEEVQVSYHFDRSIPLVVNQSDTFIATTWWTAYIANQALRNIRSKRFVYLIQEYEPLTFAHGAYFALANATYGFPHTALFSTEFLREFFRDNRLGVYSLSQNAGDEMSTSFENAILNFELEIDEFKARKSQKLLFYARPEAHASRNMFEVGILALQRFLKQYPNEAKGIEFYGMGTVGNARSVKITDDKHMKLLPKMSLQEYKNALTEFDIGLSLMYTPHPSLVPLEMAAAGMIVVTNTYENKTAEKLTKISTNILAGEPTVDSICDTLRRACQMTDNRLKRLKGAEVNWSSNWDQTFNQDFMKEIDRQIELDLQDNT